MKGLSFNFIAEEWTTPNTYDKNYLMPPDSCGIYLIVKPNYIQVEKTTTTYDIIYVGSSKSLINRYKSHPVMQAQEFYTQFYFHECKNYIEMEKILIKLIQPKLNKRWR